MATKKAEYYKFNQDGNVWDLYYFKTSADLIVETSDKKVLTSAERTKISDFLTTFNTANKLVQVESGGKIPTSVIPTLPYLSTSGGTVNGNIYVEGGLNAQTIHASTSGYIKILDTESIRVQSIDEVQDGIDFNQSQIKNVAAPTDQNDATTKEYVDNKVSSGFTTRESVKCASVANIDITSVLNALDGFTLSANDRVLLKDQTTASQNGVYKLDSTKKPVKVASDSAVGSAVFVENGNTNNDYIYHCSTANSWVAFSKPDTIKPGSGLSKIGTTLSVATGGITNAMIQNNTISLSKFNQWGLDDNFYYWNVVKNPQSNADPVDWLNSILSAIKLLRGTPSYNTSNDQTITGAYTDISVVQTNLNTAIGTIPKITSGTSNPSTTGAKNGDLYFKELS